MIFILFRIIMQLCNTEI